MISKPLPQKGWLVDLVGLFVLFLIFYTFWLGHYPLFTPDEGRYSEIAREMVISGNYITPHLNGVSFLDKPILYYWLQSVAIKWFGVKEWSLRLFPAVFGVFGCMMLYLTARILYDRRTAILSAIILATSPIYFACAHYADMNSEVAVFISCALLSFIAAIKIEREKVKRLFFYGMYIFIALACLTKGLIGLLLPILVISVWIFIYRRLDTIKQAHLLSGSILFLLLTLPWFILIQKANPSFFHDFFITQQFSRFLSINNFNNKTPFWFFIPIIIVGFFPWIVFLPQAILSKTARNEEKETKTFLLLFISIIFIFFSIPKSKTIGYILPILPPLALLVGNYLSCEWKNKGTKNSILLFIALSIIFIGLLFTLPHVTWVEFEPDFIPYLKNMAIILFIAIIAATLCFFSNRNSFFFVICTLLNITILLTLMVGVKFINVNTAKPLASQLNLIIKQQDEVINYYNYYQDIPLYLGRRIAVVADWHSIKNLDKDNWFSELHNGNMQPNNPWLIDEKMFWDKWASKKRVFVFLDKNYLNQFKLRAKNYYYLNHYKNIYLFSNKPTVLALHNPSFRIALWQRYWE